MHQQNQVAFGIDLGTTNSLLSAWQKNSLHMIPAPEEVLFPSAVRYGVQGIVQDAGYAARNARLTDPDNTVVSIKRMMGKETSIRLKDGTEKSPAEISGDVLKSLLQKSVFPREINYPDAVSAVITVPAHFSESARRATLEAAKMAGITVLRLINEPTAAALAFCHTEGGSSIRPSSKDETLMVYDLGGGTFDVSIVQRTGNHFDVKASEGDLFLGGDDFDKMLVDTIITRLNEKNSRRDLAENSHLVARLKILAEEAKKELSAATSSHIYDSNAKTLFGISIDEPFSREDFEDLVFQRVNDTIRLCEKALAAASVSRSNLSRILLVGGSSRIPLVQRLLEQSFPGVPLDARVNPDLAVAQGAAIQAALIQGLEVGTVLVDVAPASLGVAALTQDEMLSLMMRYEKTKEAAKPKLAFIPIIRKNTSVPARATQQFKTSYPLQDMIEIQVSQGESDLFSENEEIGSFFFKLQKPSEGFQSIDVSLRYTADGLVRVIVSECATGTSKEVIFRNAVGGSKEKTPLLQAVNEESENNSSINPDNIIVRRANALLTAGMKDESRAATLRSLLERYKKALTGTIDASKTGCTGCENIDELEDALMDLMEESENCS